MAHEMDSPPEHAHEIDYLKKIRRRGRWKVAGAALLAIVLVFGSFGFWTYGIGKMAPTRSLRYFLYVSEPCVVIDGSMLNESETVKGVQWKQDGSTLVATIRTVPKRTDASSTFHSQYSPSAPVETVVVNGRVAWENGEKSSSRRAGFTTCEPRVATIWKRSARSWRSMARSRTSMWRSRPERCPSKRRKTSTRPR